MNLNVEQESAIQKLQKLKCGALFMQMGTGKTRVAILLANSKAQSIDCIIWIAPASLLRDKGYMEEINRWHPLPSIYFFSIESIGSSDIKFLEMLKIAMEQRVFCIIDESITIKNTDAGRTKRLLQYYNYFDYRLILNGTPLTNGLIDLYSQIQFLSPQILKMTETQFANNFLTYRKDGYKPWKRWSKPENEEALIEIIRPYIFDYNLDIPVLLKIHDYRFSLSSEESENYKIQKDRFLINKYEVAFLEAAQHFQHIYSNCQAKINFIQSLVEKMDKVIIYVKFLSEVEILRKMFDSVVLTGLEKGDLQQFKNSKKVLICTYGVGSKGFNLQFANNIIYFTQTFDYKDKIQSMHRIYRIGQKRECNIYNFWVNTRLESLIEKSLYKKENTLNNVKSIISAEEARKL